MNAKATSSMALMAALGLALIAVDARGDISVTPASYDFGNVEVGTSVSVIITMTNVPGEAVEPLIFFGASLLEGSHGDYTITDTPDLFHILQVGESADIVVTYSPASVGSTNAVLSILSNDPFNDEELVPLSGTGVESEPDPLDEIADIIDFIDISVADGTLWGDGPGNSANNRLNALINMLEAASDLIEGGDFDQGCEQLWDVYFKVDGETPPPDFVDGPAAAELALIVLDVIDLLGCG